MKGRYSYSNAPSTGRKRTRWDETVIYLEPARGGRPLEIRPFGGVFTFAWHWIRFKSQLGDAKTFPLICRDYDYYAGTWVDSDNRSCPLCLNFNDRGLPDNLRFYPQVRYLIEGFNISALKRGDTENGTGAIQLSRYGFEDLESIGKLLPSGSVDHPEDGSTVHWERKDAVDAKSRDSFQKGNQMRIKVVSEEDAETIFKIRVGKKIFSGFCQDFGAMLDEAKQPVSEIERALEELGLMSALEEVTGRKSFVRPKVVSGTTDDVDDTDFVDDEDGSDKKNKNGKSTSLSAKAQVEDVEDFADEDFDDDLNEVESTSSVDDDESWDEEGPEGNAGDSEDGDLDLDDDGTTETEDSSDDDLDLDDDKSDTTDDVDEFDEEFGSFDELDDPVAAKEETPKEEPKKTSTKKTTRKTSARKRSRARQ